MPYQSQYQETEILPMQKTLRHSTDQVSTQVTKQTDPQRTLMCLVTNVYQSCSFNRKAQIEWDGLIKLQRSYTPHNTLDP